MDREEARRIQVGEPWQEEIANLVVQIVEQECQIRALEVWREARLAEYDTEIARLKEALSYKTFYPKNNEVYKRLRYAAPLAAYDVEKHLADLLEHEGMEGYLQDERRWVERLLTWLYRYRRALEEALAPAPRDL
jgi:hypothetical protein